jgi:5-methylcytosine-specific restriction enzyme A
MVLLFVGNKGDLYGCKDAGDQVRMYHYRGEGQLCDMKFVRGNRAIRDHPTNGKELLNDWTNKDA